MLILCFFVTSCIIVREKKNDDEFPSDLTIMEKPLISMSDQIVRFPYNDAIANLPIQWFFVDDEDKKPSNIFSIACNSDFTLCAIFSQIVHTQHLTKLYTNEGLVEIAKYSFEQKNKKSLGNIELVGDFIPKKNGRQKFYIYTYRNKTDKTVGKSAVFLSSLNNFYEFSLLQMSFRSTQFNKNDFDKIFQSIISSIKF